MAPAWWVQAMHDVLGLGLFLNIMRYYGHCGVLGSAVLLVRGRNPGSQPKSGIWDRGIPYTRSGPKSGIWDRGTQYTRSRSQVHGEPGPRSGIWDRGIPYTRSGPRGEPGPRRDLGPRFAVRVWDRGILYTVYLIWDRGTGTVHGIWSGILLHVPHFCTCFGDLHEKEQPASQAQQASHNSQYV